MSSEDVEDGFCGESDEPQLQGEGKTVETPAEANGAQGDGGEGANEIKVSEKGTEENERTKTDADDRKEKNIGARESGRTRPNERESTNPELKEGEGGVTPREVPKQSDPERARQSNLSSTSDPGTKSQSRYFSLMVILLALAFACIIAAIYLAPPKNVMKTDFDVVKVFEDGIEELKSSFTNQTERFWKILRSRGLTHLRNKDPSQPLVFLLAAPPVAHEWVDCLAIKLAEKLDPRHKTILARIDGEKKKENHPDETKKEMDVFLKKKFGDDHRAAVIHHLELLPPPSPLLFYSYCDDKNALLKKVAILFTVHMPVEPSPSLSPKEQEGSVEKYLSGEVWVKDDRDAVAALLSRIADTVVLMNGEFSGSATDLCA